MRISVDDEDAVRERDLFPETHRNNPDFLLRIKEIYVNIVDQMMPLLECFNDDINKRGDEKMDSTNISYERVISVLKYAENALPKLIWSICTVWQK